MIITPVIDTHRLSILANAFEREMVQFLQDLESRREVRVPRIRMEMEKSGFEEIRLDPTGTVLGRIGSGRWQILMSAHTGAPGAAGMASLVYAGKLIYELGMYGDFTLWIAGTAREEEIGVGLIPECALIAQPTGLRIYRGFRGRVELEESHALVQSAIATYEALFELPPLVELAPVSMLGLPAIAFGPGDAAVERTPVRQLVKAAQFYAAFPLMCADHLARH